jgi:hypothetical protein
MAIIDFLGGLFIAHPLEEMFISSPGGLRSQYPEMRNSPKTLTHGCLSRGQECRHSTRMSPADKPSGLNEGGRCDTSSLWQKN